MNDNEGSQKKKPTRKKKKVIVSEKPTRKKKKLVTPVTMSQKYECAWNKFYAEAPSWKKDVISSYPTGRQGREFSSEIARQAASLAESPNFKPKLAKYLGQVEKDVEPQMLSGFFGSN